MRVSGKTRSLSRKSSAAGSEEAWQSEFLPGSGAARPLQLHAGHIRAVRSSIRTVEAEAEVLSVPGNTDSLSPEATASQPKWISDVTSQWDQLPARYKVVFATSVAFVICNMDKVNMSVAIIPMAQDFGWSSTVSGIVQSAFFYGYLVTQIPSGYVTSKVGGRRVLPAGVGVWSAATAAVPLLAGTMPGLFFSRVLVGMGEAVAPSSTTDMIARTIATEERSRAIAFSFGGLHVGSLLGLLLAPYLIEHFGWPSVFYGFGIMGLAWVIWWEKLVADMASQEPHVVEQLQASSPIGSVGQADNETVPWRAFVRNRPLRALAYTHFTNNWFHYTMMAWLPTYFTDTLSLNLTQAAQMSLLPPVVSIIASAIAGPSADLLISAGWEVIVVRRLAQAVAFLGPAVCLTAASTVAAGDNALTVGLIAAGLGISSFSLAGLYSNHADLSPRYSPLLLGMTNTIGAIPGIVGVMITGALLDQTGSWPLALFAPSVFFFLTATAVFTIYGSAEQQDFGEANNQPFWFEEGIQEFVKGKRD